ncbi:hypothetical protein D1872_321000 [compost metagenome]
MNCRGTLLLIPLILGLVTGISTLMACRYTSRAINAKVAKKPVRSGNPLGLAIRSALGFCIRAGMKP